MTRIQPPRGVPGMSYAPGTVFTLRDDSKHGPEYPYRQVEVVGVHRLTEAETEVVLASTTVHAPVFTVDAQSIFRAGYALDRSRRGRLARATRRPPSASAWPR